MLWEGNRASGVRVRVGGEEQDFSGSRIILSAGAVHTPTILLRSGVGPAAHLQEMGIARVCDLPVGRYFFDHPFIRLELKLKPEHRPVDMHARHTNCCVKYSSGLPGSGFNDMMLFAMNHGGFGDLDPDMFGEAGIHLCLFECFSEGEVRLASPASEVQPNIDIRMLSDERDLARMRNGARHLLALGQHSSVTGITNTVLAGNTGIPASDMAKRSDDAIDEWLMSDCSDAQHGAGSCRMGPTAGPESESVVDPRCKVRGVEDLWVIDASVMPLDCRANTNFTTIMIAEKMADELRGLSPERPS